MSIIDQKRDVFGNISALNVLNDYFPKLSKLDSLSSINNENNSSNFLVELVTSLAGVEALKEHIIDTITYRLDQIEDAIKDGLKRELKEMVSCSINPSIPTWFQDGGTGVEVNVSKIDFFDIMKIDPDTTEGSLIFTNVSPGKNSTDFNTYLSYKIQDPNSTESWGNSTLGDDVLKAVFKRVGTNENNTITFTTNYGVSASSYSDKKLTDFNNDFIDSLTLFGSPGSLNSKTMFNLILEELFGTVSSSKSATKMTIKNKKQLTKEAEIRHVLDCIINSEDDVIDYSFFTFDNPTLADIAREVNNRTKGIVELKTCGNLPVQIDSELANEINDSLDLSSDKADEAKKIEESIDRIAETQASFAVETDRESVKNNFFIELIKKFTRIILNLVISPKFLSLFIINHQIIYGKGTSYDGPIDFIKKNKKLVKNIAKIIGNILLNLLLTLALKYLSFKLRQKFTKDEIEKAKNYVSIVFSYLGIPPVILEQIRRI